jgi:hypothetical protein
VTDLVERLAEAAATVIRGREAAITAGAGNLGSVYVELEIANNGDVLDATTYLEWRQTIRRGAK